MTRRDDPEDTRTRAQSWTQTVPSPSPVGGRAPRPEKLGPYRIESKLGIGGMGEVYRAYDELLARPVAIKLIRPELLGGGQPTEVARYRFRHEAQAAARLNHPNIVQIFHILETEQGDAIVMELVDGRPLSELLVGGPVDGRRLVRLAEQVALGLAEAHRKGIVHRDLKASNVMVIGEDRAKILDFGLAKLWQPEPIGGRQGADGDVLTGVGQVVGSYDSMSPEQARGYEVGPRSDLFSLGILMFQMATGEKPFTAESAMATLTRICTEPHPAIRPLAPELTPEVVGLIDTLLAKKPAKRPSSAHRVVSILSEISRIEALSGSLRGGADASVPAAAPGPEHPLSPTPIQSPPGSDGGRGKLGSGSPPALLGWRPAMGQGVPGRPRWELEAQLGEGGFGEAWLVRHRRTSERRVLKFCFESRLLEALQREIALFRLLKEELGERADIAKILDWSFEEAPYFIESEYTDGGDLRDWSSARGGLQLIPLSTRLEIVAQVAEALAAAHSVGVLHQDVKPGNILMSTDAAGHPRARLADFGIGALADPERLQSSSITDLQLAETESPSGSRLYGAPELTAGGRATVQADIYALGVLLYQVAIGDLGRALGPGWESEIADPLLRSDIAEAVDGSPEHRLASAAHLARRIRGLDPRRRLQAREMEERAEARALRVKAERAAGRRRWWLAALVILLVLGGATGMQTLRLIEERSRANQQAEVARATSDFLVELFDSSDPLEVSEEQITGRVTVRDILDRGTERAHRQLGDRPAVQARLLEILGRVYGHLGLFEPAEKRLLAALDVYGRLPSRDAGGTAELYWRLAELFERRGDVVRAREEARMAVFYEPVSVEGAGPSDAVSDASSAEPELGHEYRMTLRQKRALLDRLGLSDEVGRPAGPPAGQRGDPPGGESP